MNPPARGVWFERNYPGMGDQVIAYFSAEFGLHESLPIYSGGLGVLSGDHCKTASDLDLPFVGVGFIYPQGYFRQQIDPDGKQQAIYEKLDFGEIAATPALGADGMQVIIDVDLPGRKVYAKVWRVQVGRIPIYLMDTDVPANAPEDRELSARLYGGDQQMRISQEIVLGIGGVRALRALGIQTGGVASERGARSLPATGADARVRAGRGTVVRGRAVGRPRRFVVHHAHAGAGGQRRVRVRPD